MNKIFISYVFKYLQNKIELNLNLKTKKKKKFN